MLKAWRESGRVENEFASENGYELFLMAQKDGDYNVWNLTQELQDKGYYNDLIKVFMDEERGRATQDNYKGLITVSFMVMLMDGTRDGSRPELSIIPDHSNTATGNDYIVIRDGVAGDKKWNMTFYIAPTGHKDNPNRSSNNDNDEENDFDNDDDTMSSSSSGTCNAGAGFISVAFLFFALKKHKN